MKNTCLLTAALLAMGLAQAKEEVPAVKEHAEHNIHWGYAGAGGPDNWARLSPDNIQCAGKNQSPVNLSGFIKADLHPIEFQYQAGGSEVLNNGHTIQVNYAKGSSIRLDGQTFELLQFHFHAPSENQIRGKSYPLEGHLVHADKDGNLAVLAVMFSSGAENAGLAKVWHQMPALSGEKKALSAKFDVSDMIPAARDYYRFNGSLTTPPCSEGVRWLVLKTAATASQAQIDAFSKIIEHANNRPLQPVHARAILE